MSTLTWEQKKALEDRVWNDIRKAKKIWPHLEDIHPSFSYKLRGRSAGTATYETELIEFNPEIAANNFERFIERTPGHEIAHIISYKLYGPRGRGHKRCWKHVMRSLGYNPERCHDFDLSNVTIRRQERFKYECNCRVVHFSKTRHNRSLKTYWAHGKYHYSCPCCKSQFRPLKEMS